MNITKEHMESKSRLKFKKRIIAYVVIIVDRFWPTNTKDILVKTLRITSNKNKDLLKPKGYANV